MTPYEIRLLLHIYAIAEPLRECQILGETVVKFVNLGLIEPDDRGGSDWKTTELGTAFVTMICLTPLPKMQWVDPRNGQEIRR